MSYSRILEAAEVRARKAEENERLVCEMHKNCQDRVTGLEAEVERLKQIEVRETYIKGEEPISWVKAKDVQKVLLEVALSMRSRAAELMRKTNHGQLCDESPESLAAAIEALPLEEENQ